MMAEVKEGDVLAGKYRVERVLGQGGMGIVVSAHHLQLDQRVAIKFLLPTGVQHKETVERFAREARAAVKIRSEHVARVIDVGILETGAPYMVMEYLEGSDLSRRVSDHGPMSIPDASLLILQACEALAEAHSLGIVHRDLKPANLFLTHLRDGSVCVKLLDFGISKLTVPGAGPGLDMTSTTTVMGSPYYMSPEQMRSTRNVDARTDIWALGVILYELVSGHVPFEAETMPQLCGMVLQDQPPPLERFRTNTPTRFEAVILRCLEKHPERRFQNVGELAAALAEFAPREAMRSVERAARLSGVPGSDSNPRLQGAPSPTTGDQFTQSDFGRSSERRERSFVWPGVALALVVVLGAFGWWWQSHSAASVAAQPSASVEPARSAPVVEAPVEKAIEPTTTVTSAAPAVTPVPAANASASAAPVSVTPPRARPANAPRAGAKSQAHAAPEPPAPPAPVKPAAPTPAPRPAANPLDGRL
ncbi:MAG TPA: protein kinase [Polyangiaceae bacterium]|nr:protein kinase [Polyangiaceae bacterium]